MSEETKDATAAETHIVKVDEPREVTARPARHDTSAMALVPTSIQEAAYTARLLASSGMFKHKTPEQAFAALMIGRELGLPPAASMRAIDIIDGKPAPSADALVAACLRRSDLCEYFFCVEDDAEHSIWAAKRVGQPERRIGFTLEEAKVAGLLAKDVWKKYGNRMLGHRAAAWLAREVFPDIVLGMYSEEEVAEIAEDRGAAASKLRQQVAAATGPSLAALLTAISSVGVPGGLRAEQLPELVAEAAARAPDGHPMRSDLALAIKAARLRIHQTESHGEEAG